MISLGTIEVLCIHKYRSSTKYTFDCAQEICTVERYWSHGDYSEDHEYYICILARAKS